MAITLQRHLGRMLRRSVGAVLVVLVAMLVASIVLAEVRLAEQRERAMMRARRTLDVQVGQRFIALQAFAESAFFRGDPRGSEAYQAARVFKNALDGDIILADAQGQMLLNTRVPLGKPLPLLPKVQGRSAAKLAWETGRPAASDVFMGPVAGVPLISLATVVSDGESPRYTLLNTLPTELFARWLQELYQTQDQGVALLDSTGAVITASAAYLPDPVHRSWRVREQAVALSQVPYRLVVQSDALIDRLPGLVAGFILLLAAGVAMVVIRAAERSTSQTLARDLAALQPQRLTEAYEFSVDEVQKVAHQWRTYQHSQQNLLEQLESSELALLRILQMLPVPLLVVSADEVERTNAEAALLFGSTVKGVLEEGWMARFPVAERLRVALALQHVLATPGAIDNLDTCVHGPAGQTTSVRMRLTRVDTEDGPRAVIVLQPRSFIDVFSW